MIKSLALGALGLYQMVVSPYSPGLCRHTPSCSNYAHEAITRHGVALGVRLTAGRLARCRPFGSSGFDPVP